MEPMAPHYKSYGALLGHMQLRSLYSVNIGFKVKVAGRCSVFNFSSLKGFIKKKGMLFDRHDTLPSKFCYNF